MQIAGVSREKQQKWNTAGEEVKIREKTRKNF